MPIFDYSSSHLTPHFMIPAIIWLYLRLIFSSIAGMAFSLVLKHRSIDEKSKLSNLQRTAFLPFIKEERSNIIGTMLVLILFFLFAGSALDTNNLHDADKVVNVFWILSIELRVIYTMILAVLCATIGYSGQDIALRLFGKVNARVNAAIDFKTTEADKATGNLDSPTPAAPIQK